jgi:hypothetical protein
MLLAHVFQIDQLHARQAGQLVGQFGLLDEGARGNDGLHFGGIAGRLHGLDAGRVVEHGRHPAAGAQAENQAEVGARLGSSRPTRSPGCVRRSIWRPSISAIFSRSL